jgi:hypothetical protein
MRAVAGIASLAVTVGAIAWTLMHRDGAEDPRPPDAFLDAEVSLGDPELTPSCYTLRVVLTQHMAFMQSATASWREESPGSWVFRIERLDNPGGGPVSVWSELTLEQRSAVVAPVAFREWQPKAGDEQPEPTDEGLAEYFAGWISDAELRPAAKLARCRKS